MGMIEILLTVIAMLLALTLTGVSFIAYRKSHLRAALYLLIAFLLFTIKKVIEALSISKGIEKDIGLVINSLEVLVLLLFILALWRR
ncbi:hypothetical protein [Thermococcus sp.]|uniref:hypothetical protein n=1 Tax=Thermococcus sp. TaxID=35749 RepID=UPI0025CFDAF3|nr:hypothetical protein [Thermococcus sp.]